MPRRRPRRIILLYHSVGSSPWATPPADFARQVEWLAGEAELLSLPDLLKGDRQARLQVAISFDDGYRSLFETAMPILAAHGANATAYLNTGWIGDDEARASDASLGHYPDETFLLWREVEELARRRWTIGSHGVEHDDLTSLPADAARGQLAVSRGRIEAVLERPCSHFAYTWGRHSPALRTLVREAGYETAVSAAHAPLSPGGDPYAIPRMNIANHYDFKDFKALVGGDWDYLGWIARARGLVA